jgi:hypothetical protein
MFPRPGHALDIIVMLNSEMAQCRRLAAGLSVSPVG